MREDFARAKLTVLALGSYVRLCAEDFEAQRDDLRDQVILASRIGARGVRVFMNDPRPAGAPDAPLTEGENRAIRMLAAVEALCVASGVRVLIETHDSHSRASRLARVLSTASIGGHVGALWDAAHTWSNGEGLEESFTMLNPWLSYLQIKDVASVREPVPVDLDTGEFPIGELLAVLEQHGWHGWISLEWERAWHPELPPLEEALDKLDTWAPSLRSTTTERTA
jgi:sugar phosphate isomerase/epimerase